MAISKILIEPSSPPAAIQESSGDKSIQITRSSVFMDKSSYFLLETHTLMVQSREPVTKLSLYSLINLIDETLNVCLLYEFKILV